MDKDLLACFFSKELLIEMRKSIADQVKDLIDDDCELALNICSMAIKHLKHIDDAIAEK